MSDLINLRHWRITQYYTYYCNSIYTSKFRENDYKYVNQYLAYLLVKYGHIEKNESLFDLIEVAKQWVEIIPKLYNGLKKYKKSYENHTNKDLYNIICRVEELSNGFMQQDINNYIENIEKKTTEYKKEDIIADSILEEFINQCADVFLRLTAISVMISCENISNEIMPMPYSQRQTISSNQLQLSYMNNMHLAFYANSNFTNTYVKLSSLSSADSYNNTLNKINVKKEDVLSYLFFFKGCFNEIYNYPYLISKFKLFEEFFTIVNNPAVQKEILFPQYEEFKCIFDMYKKLYDYYKSVKCYSFSNTDIEFQNIPSSWNDLTDSYIVYKLMNNSDMAVEFDMRRNDCSMGKFVLRRASSINGNRENNHDYKGIYNLNNPHPAFNVMNFIKSEDGEIEFAIKNKHMWVIEDITNSCVNKGLIVCCAIILDEFKVDNKYYQTPKLALEEFGEDNYAIFDSVIVYSGLPSKTENIQGENEQKNISCLSYRGMGFQRLMIILANSLACKSGKKFICATVSETNTYSFNNFIYERYKKVNDKMTGKDKIVTYNFDHGNPVSRYLLKLDLS